MGRIFFGPDPDSATESGVWVRGIEGEPKGRRRGADVYVPRAFVDNSERERKGDGQEIPGRRSFPSHVSSPVSLLGTPVSCISVKLHNSARVLLWTVQTR